MPRNQNRVGNTAKVTNADIQIRCQAGACKKDTGWAKKCSGFQPLLLRIDQIYDADILMQQANCQTNLTMHVSPKASKKIADRRRFLKTTFGATKIFICIAGGKKYMPSFRIKMG